MLMTAEIRVPTEVVVKIGDETRRMAYVNYDFQDWLRICHELGLTDRTITTKY